MSEIRCKGLACANQLDVSSMEKYPDGASAIEIHVKQGNQYLRMQAQLCAKCTSEKLMTIFEPQAADA